MRSNIGDLRWHKKFILSSNYCWKLVINEQQFASFEDLHFCITNKFETGPSEQSGLTQLILCNGINTFSNLISLSTLSRVLLDFDGIKLSSIFLSLDKMTISQRTGSPIEFSERFIQHNYTINRLFCRYGFEGTIVMVIGRNRFQILRRLFTL